MKLKMISPIAVLALSLSIPSSSYAESHSAESIIKELKGRTFVGQNVIYFPKATNYVKSNPVGAVATPKALARKYLLNYLRTIRGGESALSASVVMKEMQSDTYRPDTYEHIWRAIQIHGVTLDFSEKQFRLRSQLKLNLSEEKSEGSMVFSPGSMYNILHLNAEGDTVLSNPLESHKLMSTDVLNDWKEYATSENKPVESFKGYNRAKALSELNRQLLKKVTPQILSAVGEVERGSEKILKQLSIPVDITVTQTVSLSDVAHFINFLIQIHGDKKAAFKAIDGWFKGYEKAYPFMATEIGYVRYLVEKAKAIHTSDTYKEIGTALDKFREEPLAKELFDFIGKELKALEPSVSLSARLKGDISIRDYKANPINKQGKPVWMIYLNYEISVGGFAEQLGPVVGGKAVFFSEKK